MNPSHSTERFAGALIVVAMHAAVLWGLWTHNLIPTPQESITLFVNFIAPPSAPNKIHAAFRLDINEFNGVASVQLILDHIEPG